MPLASPWLRPCLPRHLSRLCVLQTPRGRPRRASRSAAAPLPTPPAFTTASCCCNSHATPLRALCILQAPASSRRGLAGVQASVRQRGGGASPPPSRQRPAFLSLKAFPLCHQCEIIGTSRCRSHKRIQVALRCARSLRRPGGGSNARARQHAALQLSLGQGRALDDVDELGLQACAAHLGRGAAQVGGGRGQSAGRSLAGLVPAHPNPSGPAHQEAVDVGAGCQGAAVGGGHCRGGAA